MNPTQKQLSVAAALLAATILAPHPARAETTVIVNPGIATDYTDATVDLHTRVTQITIDDPVVVTDSCLGVGPIVRVRGTISGVGRGGITLALNSAGALVSVQRGLADEYAYTVDYGFFYSERGAGSAKGPLVVFHHGGGGNILVALDGEYPPPARVANPANSIRQLEQLSDIAIGAPALLDHCTYFAANRWLRADGSTVGSYASLAYTEALAAAVRQRYPNLPGVEVGAPLPCEITIDAAASRDITRAGQLVHERVFGTRTRHTIGIGVSGGARLLAQMSGGQSGTGQRSGGLYVTPYDPSSGTILDYVIVRGLPDSPPSAFGRVDQEQPLAVPMIFTSGTCDPRMVNAWAYIAAIAGGRGLPADAPSPVPVAAMVRLYELRGAQHRWGWDEGGCGLEYASDLGSTGPIFGALIRNARERLEDGRPEPESRFAGRLVGGALVFDQAGGATTAKVPFVDDPADTLNAVVPAVPTAAQLLDWKRIDALLPHGPALVLPLYSARLGTYTSTEGGGIATPAPVLAPYADLLARFPRYNSFRSEVDAAVEALEADRLYDPRVEHPHDTAARFRSLFP